MRTPEERVASVVSSIVAAQAEIAASPFYTTLLGTLKQGQDRCSMAAAGTSWVDSWKWSSVKEFVVYGLGSFEFGESHIMNMFSFESFTKTRFRPGFNPCGLRTAAANQQWSW